MTPLLDATFRRKLDLLEVVARKVLGGELRGERRTKHRGPGSLFAEHRSYSPGDDLRYLDWNVYGRFGTLMTKEFEGEGHLRLVLLVDASRSMAFGDPSKLDHARRIAAALGYLALRNSEAVTLVVLEDGAAGVSTFRGSAKVPALFAALERIEARGTTRLADSVRAAMPAVKRGGIAVLLSDFLDPAGFAPALDPLFHRRLRTFALQVTTPQEEEPPLHGAVRLIDAEDGRARAIEITPRILAAYREAVRRHARQIAGYCVRREMSHAKVSTATPFDEAVLGLLRRGETLLR